MVQVIWCTETVQGQEPKVGDKVADIKQGVVLAKLVEIQRGQMFAAKQEMLWREVPVSRSRCPFGIRYAFCIDMWSAGA